MERELPGLFERFRAEFAAEQSARLAPRIAPSGTAADNEQHP